MSATSSISDFSNPFRKYEKYGGWVPGWDTAREMVDAEHAYAHMIRDYEGTDSSKSMQRVKYLSTEGSTVTSIGDASGNPGSMVKYANKRKGGFQRGAAHKKARQAASYDVIKAGAYGMMHGRAGRMQMVQGRRFGEASRQGELKWLDKNVNASLSSTADLLAADMLTLPQNTDVGGRIGNKAWIRKLCFKGIVSWDPALGVIGTQTCTFYVILDTQTNKALTPITDIFTSGSLHKALHNLDNSQRFKVLHKKVITFNIQAGTVGAGATMGVPFEFYLDFSKSPIQIDYTGATGVVGERTVNNLLFLASATTDATAGINGTMRIRYTD